jgi:DNA helicase IV
MSQNRKQYIAEEKKLESELEKMKSSIPNWLWNTIIKTISLGKVNLNDIKQKRIQTLLKNIEKLVKIFEKIDVLEDKLNVFQDSIMGIYINDYKRKKYKRELQLILKEYSFYDLSIENEKYPFLSKFFSNSEYEVKEWNRSFVSNEKKNQADFFKTVEENPLTESQQNAVVINEDNNLVIAGAGSGKTSVIVAKIGYLVKRGFAKPEEILVLAFNKKAVEEIKERITEKLKLETNVSTFHSYGLKIIGKANKKPIICSWATDDKELTKLIRTIIKDKLNEPDFYKIFKKYFIEHFVPYKNEFDFKSKGEYYDYIKNYDLRTLDGKLVKSYEELEISNFLRLKNINYIYEHPYEHETATSQYRQYQPDFYLPDYGIYIEHYGISKNGKTAPYINNEDYLNGMVWKRSIHRNYNTTCIETYSYEKSEDNLLTLLEKKLKAYDVKFQDVSFEEVLEIFNLKNGIVDRFTKLTMQFLNHFKSNKYTIDTLSKKIGFLDFREKAFLEIFENIFNEYENKKNEFNCIDFYDMINNAIDIVNSGLYQPKYKYILIDEFQDISSSRSDLIRALCEKIDDSILTVVGDDWQSINRFAGSDVSIIKNFENHFGVSETIFLDNTFRFDNNVSKVASNFITKNPSQIKKSIKTFKTSNTPSIYIYRSSKGEENYISRIFNFLEKKVDKKKEVLILGRFNYLRPDNFKELQNRYENKFDIKFMSVHASKGLGADFVILLGVDKGKMGFPCEIEDDPLLDIVMAQQEEFHFSEERRLFYVALTRTKEKLFIVSDIHNGSEFIKEIVEDNTEDEIQFLNERDYVAKYCPECELGSLVEKETEKGSFYGCSNYPLCDYTEEIRRCSSCDANLHKLIDQNIAICENKNCSHTEVLCKKCNSYMSVRKKDNREFLGCSSYFKTGCTFTQQHIK